MPLADGTDTIADDEILYRRIPASMDWYDPASDRSVAPDAFRPRKNEDTIAKKGISLSRAKFVTLDEAARGRPGKRYFVAVLLASDLAQNGIEVVTTPEFGGPGHASIPALNYADRRTDRVMDMKRLLAERLCLRVEGPFHTPEG